MFGRPRLPGPIPVLDPVTPRRREAARRAAQMLLGFVLTAVLVNALVGERGVLQLWRARAEYRQLDRSIQALKAENAALLERARQLRDDPRAIEQLAREELGLIHKGEVVAIVKGARDPQAVNSGR
jgi:cell division protein FtsB